MVRGQQQQFHRLIAAEEEEWERRRQAEAQLREQEAGASNFEEWRQSARGAGF